MNNYSFTWNNLKNEYINFIENGYQILTCAEYVRFKDNLRNKTVVNRIDIDFSVKKVSNLLDIFDELDIKGSFFCHEIYLRKES